MITRERYGVRSDGRPITEVSTYIPVEPDHPLGEELDGEEGTWVRVSVGNSLTAMGATEVSKAKFTEAVEEAQLLHEAVLADLADRHERMAQEKEARQAQAMAELVNIGVSPETVAVILAQAREGW